MQYVSTTTTVGYHYNTCGSSDNAKTRNGSEGSELVYWCKLLGVLLEIPLGVSDNVGLEVIKLRIRLGSIFGPLVLKRPHGFAGAS